MNKFTISLLFFLTAIVFESKAQSFMGIQFNYMQPLADYSQNLDANPAGIGFNYMFKPAIFKKLYVGTQIGVSMYATDNYTETVQIGEDNSLDIKVDEEDCFFSYNLLTRYYLSEGKLISPYVEAHAGGLSFFSTKMTDEEFDEHFDNSTTFHGTALQLGLGGGLAVHIVDNLWIDLNVIYNSGSRTNYRNISSADAVYRSNPSLGKFESYTNNLNYSLGVQFGF